MGGFAPPCRSGEVSKEVTFSQDLKNDNQAGSHTSQELAWEDKDWYP